MQKLHPPSALARALALPAANPVQTNEPSCAFCGCDLEGQGVPYKPKGAFGDYRLMAFPTSGHICPGCSALQNRDAMSGGKSAGVVTAAGFSRVGKSETYLAALASPPNEPFAFAIHNAQLQHVWWHAPVNYNRDVFTIRYGFESLLVDRRLAINLANLILAYEATQVATQKIKYFRVLRPLSDNLKGAGDGAYTAAFVKSDDPEALALKAKLMPATFGTLWATQRLLTGARALDASTIEEALATLEQGQDA